MNISVPFQFCIIVTFFPQELHLIPAVVDGEFILKAPEELLASKELHAVPYLIGVNNNEYGWFIYGVSFL